MGFVFVIALAKVNLDEKVFVTLHSCSKGSADSLCLPLEMLQPFQHGKTLTLCPVHWQNFVTLFSVFI